MAVPKRKTSKQRRDKRRTHLKMKIPSWTTCPNCDELISPHTICAACGYYNSKQIIQIKDKKSN